MSIKHEIESLKDLFAFVIDCAVGFEEQNMLALSGGIDQLEISFSNASIFEREENLGRMRDLLRYSISEYLNAIEDMSNISGGTVNKLFLQELHESIDALRSSYEFSLQNTSIHQEKLPQKLPWNGYTNDEDFLKAIKIQPS